MKTFVIMVMLVFVSPQAMAGNSYSAAQCNAWFKKIDRNKDGSIGPSENANQYLARITLGSESENRSDNFIMSRAFFIAECSIGSLGKPAV